MVGAAAPARPVPTPATSRGSGRKGTSSGYGGNNRDCPVCNGNKSISFAASDTSQCNAHCGAMLRWLVEHGAPGAWTLSNQLENGVRVDYYHDGTGYEIARSHEGPLFEALSAACGAMAKEDA